MSGPDPDSPKKKSKRGRPKLKGAKLHERRSLVLDAASVLLVKMSSDDITVEQLIQIAGITRPTFYRWFPGGVPEVVAMLISEASRDLIERIVAVIQSAHDVEKRIAMGINAYFDWCVSNGAVSYGLYREGFNQSSPIYQHRRNSVDTITTAFQAQAQKVGLQHVNRLSIETMVCWVESAGSTLLKNYPPSQEAIETQKRITVNMFILLVRSEQEWGRQLAKSQNESDL